MSKAKGGGDTPPKITTGSFVSWSGGKGRVDLIVTTGKVPGVSGDVEATADSPAARIVVWRDGKATREKIAASTHTLKRIAPLDGKPEGKTGIAAVIDLQAKHAEYVADAGLPESATITGQAAATAYSRGYVAWPGEAKTALDPDEWAIGRLMHLFKVAMLDETQTNDADLLHPDHTLAQRPVDDDSGVQDELVFVGDAEATLTGDLSDADGEDEDGEGDEDTVTLPLTIDEVRAAAEDPEVAADLASRLTEVPPTEPEPEGDVTVDAGDLRAELAAIEAVANGAAPE